MLRRVWESDEAICLRKVCKGSWAFIEGADSRGSRIASVALVTTGFLPFLLMNYGILKADKYCVPGSYQARIADYRR